MMVIKFAYVGEFTSRRRRVGVGEFERRRVDRIPSLSVMTDDRCCQPLVQFERFEKGNEPIFSHRLL